MELRSTQGTTIQPMNGIERSTAILQHQHHLLITSSRHIRTIYHAFVCMKVTEIFLIRWHISKMILTPGGNRPS